MTRPRRSTTGPEPRPLLHVTPPTGWLNDPVAGVVHAGRQHLFFQYVPTSTSWQLGCHWGHLVGDDLVRWDHLPVALAPGGGDDGVWSGSAVVDAGGPVLVYTSVLDGARDHGRIALARPADDSLVGWRKRAEGPVLHPPEGLGVTHFRDPFVWGTPGDWRMLVGAGLAGRGGAALLYASADLVAWTFRGVLAESGGPAAGLGTVWECPQLVALGAAHALLVSVWEAGTLDHVAVSVGRLEDDVFHPGQWDRVGHGGSAYALTTYRDRAGRVAATAWLRREADPGIERTGWEGVLSLPQLMTLRNGRLHVAPHPDVDTLRLQPLAVVGGAVDLGDAGTGDLDVRLDPGQALELVGGDGEVVALGVDDGVLTVHARGALTPVPVAEGGVVLRVVVDRGVLEAWTGDGRWVALRLPLLAVTRARLPYGGSLEAWSVEPVQGRA